MRKKLNKELLPFDHGDFGKVPPQSIDAEEAVLGALLIDGKALVRIYSLLEPQVFYKEQHRIICDAMLQLVNEESAVDIVTVAQKLIEMGELDVVGGAYYLSQLTTKVATANNVFDHYKILLKCFYNRELIRIGSDAIKMGYEDEENVFEAYDFVMNSIEKINVHAGKSQIISTMDAYKNLLDVSKDLPDDILKWYATGDSEIDRRLKISPNNILLLAGKSGSGKTTLISYMARLLLKQYPKNVSICWYTMEDEASKILMTFISPELKLSYDQITGKDYDLSQQEKDLIENSKLRFENYDIEFFERSASVAQIKAHFIRFCAKRPKKFCILIVDNIMLLSDNHQEGKYANQVKIDDEIANGFQNLFVRTKNEYMVSIWLVQHLTKDQLAKTNASEGYRPREDNIRGSARFRDAATQVIAVNRPGEFNDIVEMYKETEFYNPTKFLIISEILKNRNGRTGIMRHFGNLDYKIFYPLS